MAVKRKMDKKYTFRDEVCVNKHWSFSSIFIAALAALYLPKCDIPVPGIPVPGNSSIFLMVSEPVSKKFGTEKSLGTGLEKIWYRKKSRNRSRKNLVPKKVPEPVSKKFSTEKSLTTGIKKIYMYFRLQRSPCELNNASHHRMPGLHQKSLPGNAVTLLFLV